MDGEHNKLSGGMWELRFKRPFDVLIFIGSQVVLFPMFALIWLVIPLAIWLEDRGPVIYRQLRVGYDERISSFAEGKQLQRLRRPVRSRGDGFCDACGSPQPSTLYGLRDKAGEQVYFVGSTCLQALSRKGVVVRAFGRQSATTAYDAEMHRRDEEASTSRSIGEAAIEHPTELDCLDQTESAVISAPAYISAVLAYETQGHYHSVVTLADSTVPILSVGSAVEIRVDEDGGKSIPAGFALHRVKQSGPDALIRCVLRAWEQAAGKLSVEQDGSRVEAIDADLGETLLVEAGSGN
ncbi:MAG: sugar transferase [Chloroflexi bacterium]|nr:sugar transferase [Chloroflexota bacterium]